MGSHDTQLTTVEEENMIGAYGSWAASLQTGPGKMSIRHPDNEDTEKWRHEARDQLEELLARPDISGDLDLTVEDEYVYDGLHVEELSWQLPYGPRTKAVFLKPESAREPLPGVLGLHCHGGCKYFGRRKIAATDRLGHPLMDENSEGSYGGRRWANALAKRGYAVLVHDTFPFSSRRVRLEDVPSKIRNGVSDPSEDDPASIEAYDDWAADHESIMARSLFSAGTTWPGVFLNEDQRALDVLCDRDDVDETRIGCGGLSVGGLRTVFLGGMDERIDSAVCVGMMTTWQDYLLYQGWTHTWMAFVPRCPNYLDYSEILGLRAPKPTLVLNNRQDPIFTLDEMKSADQILTDVYTEVGAENNYRCSFYDGGHKFDLEMQSEAFDWFDETIA